MRKRYLVLGLALACGPATWGTVSPPRTHRLTAAPAPVALVQAAVAGQAATDRTEKEVDPAAPGGGLVTIDAFREVKGKAVQLSGVGVVATRLGHIYAPIFVAEGAEVLVVTFVNGARAPARMLAADRQNQLAVLKVPTIPEGVRVPDVCAAASEGSGKGVSMIQFRDKRLHTTAGRIVGEQPAVGPLRNVLEVTVPSGSTMAGGILLDQRGALVGLALATAEGEDDKSQSVYAVPASRIQQAVERIVRGAEGTFTPRQVALTEA